jgi:hypothetical protein
MADGTSPLARCGIDAVEIARVERWPRGTPHEDLLRTLPSATWLNRTGGKLVRHAGASVISSPSRPLRR